MDSYTLVNLARDVDDAAPKFGHGDVLEARFANGPLALEQTELSLQRYRPGQRQPFAHKHKQAEEVYVVVGGSGRIHVEGEAVDLAALDAIRVAPGAVRAFEAGPDGLDVLAVSPQRQGDAEVVPPPWG